MRLASLGIPLLLLALPLSTAVAVAPGKPIQLPRLNADAARTSVSGLSSGGFMAVQYAVAFSRSVSGVGVVAGGPYNCVFLNFGGTDACMNGTPSGVASLAAAKGFADLGEIDPVAGIAHQKVYLFSGTRDNTVVPAVVAATRDFFFAAGVPPANLSYTADLPAGHGFVAPGAAHECGATAAPYVDRCIVQSQGQSQDYDQAGAILARIYGPLQPPAQTLSASIQTFDQTPFLRQSGQGSSMDASGYVYIPGTCAGDARGCAVHVVFHGCKQEAVAVHDAVYRGVGYNRWADTNHLIVLYPQAIKSPVEPYNPEACWDWWGYTGLNFQVQSGVQLSVLKAMVDRLTRAK